MKKSIYIFGKITGDPDYKEKFNKVEKMLVKKGFAVMNPAILPEGFEYENYMHICFAMIDVCDYMYALEGWEDSPGATREKHYGDRKRKLFIY